MTGGPGLSLRQFCNSIEDSDLRRLLNPGVLGILDAIFSGQVCGEDLQKVAHTLIDLDAMLVEEVGRRLILELLPEQKRSELEERIGREIKLTDTGGWTQPEINRARDFFGLFEERIQPPIAPASKTISPSYGLFDHQRDAVRRLLPVLLEDERRALLHFPTGVGKTRTAMHVVAEVLRTNEPSVVVWLASGKELLEQAVLAFEEAWAHLGTRPLNIGTMWGDRTPDLVAFDDGLLVVGLAKGWSVLSGSDPEWAIRLAPQVRLVVFDEAHQSIASTYKRITEELTIDYRCSLLGLSATPGRTWADIDADGKLAEFYGSNKIGLEVPGRNPIDYLIEHHYLARPSFTTLFSEPGLNLTDKDINRISGSLDIPAEILTGLSMSKQYVTAVISAIDELLKEDHKRILVFAASVEHALVITAILAARCVHAGVVTATTPERIRGQTIRSFKSDDAQPMVLVNFGVLTTGFDAPKASAAVIARPTQSLVLYSQMVGRAIRGPKAGGTDTCNIVTVVDPGLPGFGNIAEAFLNWEDVWA